MWLKTRVSKEAISRRQTWIASGLQERLQVKPVLPIKYQGLLVVLDGERKASGLEALDKVGAKTGGWSEDTTGQLLAGTELGESNAHLGEHDRSLSVARVSAGYNRLNQLGNITLMVEAIEGRRL